MYITKDSDHLHPNTARSVFSGIESGLLQFNFFPTKKHTIPTVYYLLPVGICCNRRLILVLDQLSVIFSGRESVSQSVVLEDSHKIDRTICTFIYIKRERASEKEVTKIGASNFIEYLWNKTTYKQSKGVYVCMKPPRIRLDWK